jgi:hypothetical protein
MIPGLIEGGVDYIIETAEKLGHSIMHIKYLKISNEVYYYFPYSYSSHRLF